MCSVPCLLWGAEPGTRTMARLCRWAPWLVTSRRGSHGTLSPGTQEHWAGGVGTSLRLEAAVSAAAGREALLDWLPWGGLGLGWGCRGHGPTLGRAGATLGLQRCGPIPAVLTDLRLELPLPPIPRALHVLPHYPRSHLPPSPAEPLLSLLLQTMGETYIKIVVALGILQFMLRADDQTVEVTEELMQEQEEQHNQEMALLQEMEQRCQKLPEGNLLLSAYQHSWFWTFVEMFLTFFSFYWLPRLSSSACRGTLVEARKKRRRRRRKRMLAIGYYGDKLDQITSQYQCLEWKNMENSEEEGMKEMNHASAKPFPQKTFGQSCIQGIQ